MVNWNDQPFGEVTDIELARRLGVSDVTVGKQRRKRGISTFDHKAMGRGPGERAHINWDEQPLGKVPDKELARCLGVDPSSVYSARSIRKIPTCSTTARFQNNSAVPGHEELHLSPVVRNKPHVHKCPMCNELSPCDDKACKVDDTRVTEDGRFYGPYETCNNCLEALETTTETTGYQVSVGISPRALK